MYSISHLHSPSESARHQDSHKKYPGVWEVPASFHPEKSKDWAVLSNPKAQSRAEGGLPLSLAQDTTLGPRIVGGSKELRWGNLFFLLVLWFLGCYHNSMDSSLNSAEHMGNLYLAYHFKLFLPHTYLPPQRPQYGTNSVGKKKKKMLNWVKCLLPLTHGPAVMCPELWPELQLTTNLKKGNCSHDGCRISRGRGNTATTSDSSVEPSEQRWPWPKTATKHAKQREGTEQSLKLVIKVKTDQMRVCFSA